MNPKLFRHALVRPPAPGFERGLSTAGLGAPDLELARSQHRGYCAALEDAGLSLIHMEPSIEHPDGPFVEDPVIVLGGAVISTNPGAPSRRGEVSAVAAAFPDVMERIPLPWGDLDGGDVMVADGTVFIGRSARTDRVGARGLRGIVESMGYRAVEVPVPGGLHLKTGVNAIGPGALVMTSDYAGSRELEGFDRIVVPEEERYAANCLWVRDRIIMPLGYPRTRGRLLDRGYRVVEVDMSEYRKLDGGLTCLSVRW
jgi:dimethylargininase